MFSSIFKKSIYTVMFIVLISCGSTSSLQNVGAAATTESTSALVKPNPSLEVQPTAIPLVPPQTIEDPTIAPTPTSIYLPTIMSPSASYNDHYVSPNGSPNGDGSLSKPWDLQDRTGVSSECETR